MKLVFFSLILGFLGLVRGATYEGYHLLQVIPETQDAIDQLKVFSTFSDISLLSPIRGRKRPVEVMVGPDSYKAFIWQMELMDIETHLIENDVQTAIDKHILANEEARTISQGSPKMEHTFYRTLNEINAELDNLETAFPSLFSSSVIGLTYEARNIRLTKVSSGGGSSLPVIWIDCGIHAREWVSPASCLYFLDQLSTYGQPSNDVTDLLDAYDFLVLTVTNPDGYDYSWSDDRLWRKNRYPFGVCFGTDLNRNFDSDFGGPGTSNQTCMDTYHGPSPFSEFETQAMRDAMTPYGSGLKAVFTFHSYSQLWMTPYGYTTAFPPDYDEMMRVAGIGVSALEAVYGTLYQYGSIATTIYEAAGGSIDWTYDSLGVLYSYALELRDQGQNGFLLPPEQIEPTATEAWEGTKAAIRAFQ